MLIILSDGRSLSASALAETAGMTPQTASSHLTKLLESFCKLGWEQLQRQLGVQPLA
ncbi:MULTISPECIES: helix-turn-helix domain-containing protein [Pseudomonas]|uniref:helix-turn-helix domain-containing protein n=1 Tax=Pseudomonas TaxID=286 RepID=UPI001FF0B93B|nr:MULTISPECIES: helix-turn-helix domain-containing protein [Pseudomonas]